MLSFLKSFVVGLHPAPAHPTNIGKATSEQIEAAKQRCPEPVDSFFVRQAVARTNQPLLLCGITAAPSMLLSAESKFSPRIDWTQAFFQYRLRANPYSVHLGEYSAGTNKITIYGDFFCNQSLGRLLKTVAHEVTHAHQAKDVLKIEQVLTKDQMKFWAEGQATFIDQTIGYFFDEPEEDQRQMADLLADAKISAEITANFERDASLDRAMAPYREGAKLYGSVVATFGFLQTAHLWGHPEAMQVLFCTKKQLTIESEGHGWRSELGRRGETLRNLAELNAGHVQLAWT